MVWLSKNWNKVGFVNLKMMVLFGVFLIFFNLAAWQKDGVPICTAPGLQWRCKAEPLTAGRVAITWEDVRSDTLSKVYLQVLDSLGNPLFTKDGIRVSQRAGTEVYHQTVTHGSDIFIAWEGAPGRSRINTDIFVTKIDGLTGVKKWGDIPVCTAIGDQYEPRLCLDGSGEGCYITWTDYRSDSLGNAPTIWCSHITSQGQVTWSRMVGLGVSVGGGVTGSPAIAPAGDKAVLFWEDYREPDPRMFCQVVDSAGEIYFPQGSKLLHTGLFPTPTSDGPATSDGTNAFVVFMTSNTKRSIKKLESDPARGQKLKDTLFLWGANGFCIISPVNSFLYGGFGLVPDFSGGLSICFGKGPSWGAPDLYCQSIRTDTTLRFAEEGLKVWENYSTDPIDDIWMDAIDDGFGGIVVTWDTWSDSTEGNIMANRIDTLGPILWGNGVKVCEVSGNQIHPRICRADSNFIIVWQDERNNKWDVYAQCLDLDGNVGIEEKHRKEISRPITLQIYPNPSNQFTTIKFQLSLSGYTTVKIYNAIGQEIRTLVSRQKESGYYSLLWDGRDNSEKTVPSGVYLCELKVRGGSENLRAVKKTVLINHRRDYE